MKTNIGHFTSCGDRNKIVRDAVTELLGPDHVYWAEAVLLVQGTFHFADSMAHNGVADGASDTSPNFHAYANLRTGEFNLYQLVTSSK
jgi:hypothetical protein